PTLTPSTSSALASGPAAAPALSAAPADTPPAAPEAPKALARLAPMNETKENSALATDVVRDVQSQLLRVGCGGEDGEAAGAWSPAWQKALPRFNSSAHASLDVEHPSPDTVAAIQGQTGRVCPLTCGPGTELRDGTCVARSKPSREPASRK